MLTDDRALLLRFMRHVDLSVDACWLWTGSLNEHGYGQVRMPPTVWKAHRVSYALFVGAIPAGLFVCHHCDTPACVNPDHLFLGTAQDNIRDMWAKGRGVWKTHCKHGHEYTAANTMWTQNHRKCRACGRRYMREWNLRRLGAA